MPTPVLRPAVFADLPGIVAGFSTRHGGTSRAPFQSLNLGINSGDDPAAVRENRRLLLDTLGLDPDRLAMARQVHGTDVEVVETPGVYPDRDGLVTRRPGLVLCITAADCAAVLLADPIARVIGACHSGWRGTAGGIVPNTIAQMQSLGADPQRIHAYVSPCISAANFEVGPEVTARFDPAFVRAMPNPGKCGIDLKAVIKSQLLETSVPEDRIEVSDRCTFTETDDFFSYRAEQGQTGRMMGLIAMNAALAR